MCHALETICCHWEGHSVDTRLTDATVKRLPVPLKGNRIHYDADVKGFGCRVTLAGSRAFIET